MKDSTILIVLILAAVGIVWWFNRSHAVETWSSHRGVPSDELTPQAVQGSAGDYWKKRTESPHVGKKIDWVIDAPQVAFFKSGNINIFGSCKEVDDAIGGKVRVRGRIERVSDIDQSITISNATLEPLPNAIPVH